jgi:diguanylate cyclase (GGDEF)-like protein
MRAQSPLTGLPGNVRIEEEIESRVQNQQPFAILYADLDHFKAYNDHYGFMRGDQVIQFTARIAQEAALALSDGEAFVGHVGGDDFVIVCPPGAAESISQALVDRFDAESPALYDDEDRERGYVEVTNRRGEMQRFPLLSISIGVATSELRAFAHYAEAVAVATEMKSFTKTSAGSSWAVDRRAI